MSRSTAKQKITNVFKPNASAGITGTNSQTALTGMIDDIYDDLQGKAATPTNGNLLKTDANGQAQDAGISASAVSTHLSATNNPHNVTKSQVGLGNVDNTSDEDKPISNATQTALNTKADAEETETALATKANKDGYYDTLGAGYAKSLLGNGAGVSREITQDTAGGNADIADGIASFKSIYGNAIAWNQLANKSTQLFSLNANCTVAKNGQIYTVTPNEGVTSYSATFRTTMVHHTYGHKYLMHIKVKPLENSVLHIARSVLHEYEQNITANTWNDVLCIVSYGQSTPEIYATLGIRSGNAITTLEIDGDAATYFDLTLMFGAGNEPTSVEEFRKLFPSDYYAYNAGELLPLKATGLETIGFNQWDEEWEVGSINAEGEELPTAGAIRAKNYNRCFPNTIYYAENPETLISSLYLCWYDSDFEFIRRNPVTRGGSALTSPNNAFYFRISVGSYGTTYNNDICINLSWSGYRNGEYEPYWRNELALPITTMKSNGVVIFPDGLKSAGTAHDEIVVQNGIAVKAIKRVGVVDLGTLDWGAFTTLNGLSRTFGTINDFIGGVVGQKSNILTSKMSTITSTSELTGNEPHGIFGYTNNRVFVIVGENEYSNIEQFKTAMNGVMLYYELATPIEYTLDEPFAVNYPVSDFGIESVQPIGVDAQGVPQTAPLKASIVYGPNVVDAIRRLPENYEAIADFKTTIGNLCTALGTSLDKTITPSWNGGVGTFVITDNPTE